MDALRAVMTGRGVNLRCAAQAWIWHGNQGSHIEGSRTAVNGSLICQNEKIALQFNVAIQSRAIGKLLVLPRFSQSPRERQ